ncbi:MAG TPA: hypothetical protein VKX16_03280, partial [Chloroflexota bacterium]|nr:hypothetical protein [Chloroflexota bacterium]
AHATPEILKYLYIQALPKMAEGTANKLFVVPSELQGIASMGATFSAGSENGSALPLAGRQTPAANTSSQ